MKMEKNDEKSVPSACTYFVWGMMIRIITHISDKKGSSMKKGIFRSSMKESVKGQLRFCLGDIESKNLLTKPPLGWMVICVWEAFLQLFFLAVDVFERQNPTQGVKTCHFLQWLDGETTFLWLVLLAVEVFERLSPTHRVRTNHTTAADASPLGSSISDSHPDIPEQSWRFGPYFYLVYANHYVFYLLAAFTLAFPKIYRVVEVYCMVNYQVQFVHCWLIFEMYLYCLRNIDMEIHYYLYDVLLLCCCLMKRKWYWDMDNLFPPLFLQIKI